ncbi:NACHT domain-containing protein [Cyanobacterium aponinum]|uniref:NACHT domain-containing protein n=1 Tax=Cyanobacterium aponinum 0216 TaxID=2676140 RepID=A0A844H207_9CHRO|nr:NACHT domain-containing protein [Cyanobacterium aponinum]MTF40385.1 NACHT domain-containing protein [Cyanobacterium aponinum 0216]
MSLNTAHEGYEYQDLLTSYFILQEILNENNSTFKIDTKEYEKDKFDDLTITNQLGIFKKQIKYSNEIINKQLEKEILSQDTDYGLVLDKLFHSWNDHPNKDNCKVRICLAWQEPIDELKDVLKQYFAQSSFLSHTTQIYQVDIDKLWPHGQEPINSWRRFRQQSQNIDRQDFQAFCNHLIIETNFPKQSSDRSFSGQLETIVLEQITKLGIGEFPNHKITPIDFALRLMELIRKSRSRGFEIQTQDIFKELNIQTDYGSIEQVFPIDEQKNIKTEDIVLQIKNVLNNESRIILTGEPGSGKSWLIQNLQNELKDSGLKVVKHYCYTELQDKQIKNRITVNIFYGNLINDILTFFPKLIKKKQQRYASNLNELNNLLENIEQETLLIIDGLDHIDRVLEFNRNDLTLSDIEIIKAITKLKTSDKVKILIVSQPIESLHQLSDYKKTEIPSWQKTDILEYFIKTDTEDFEIIKDKSLSDSLLEKSNGNPLYLSYLIEEIKNVSTITEKFINSLPAYSYNLKEYYQYLLNKLSFDAIVPQVLSGANFSLSINELKEITGQGKKVNDAIQMLSPILKENHLSGGFIIYHESFRRFIIEKLKEDEIDIKYAIFKPLIEWFKTQDFYDFPKAYHFYFQLLYDNQDFEIILNFLNNDFITNSIYAGYSFDAVKHNYRYLAQSAIKQKNFPKLVQASEINKVLSSTEHIYEEGFSVYLSALGYLKGFKTLADYLTFERKPTLPLLLGLKACYLCDQNQQPAPWELYFEYFDNSEILVSDFKYYIRGLLIFKDTETLIKIANEILNNYPQYIKSFKNELLDYKDNEYIDELKSIDKVFDEVINYVPSINGNLDLIDLAQKLLEKNHIYEDDLPLLESFFIEIENNINDKNLILEIIQLFKANNWFYNWIIYYIKIKSLQGKSIISDDDIKNAFNYLIYDTEPFKGEPRTCDLYSAENFIYESIATGLKFIKNEELWSKIIELLIKLSNETTTGLRKSLGGPLTTDKLFHILDENANDINREKVIQVFERLISEKQDYHLHSYIAEYHFRLSKQYSIIGEAQKANSNYREGIKFFFGYTSWKDISLEDVINSIENLSKFDNKLGYSNLKKLKSLVDAVSSHTSGKGTKHFPIEWFQKFLNINFHDASKYLLSQLIQESYNWVHEDQLKCLLIEADGQINPIIELFIYRTFPLELSERFLTYGLTLVEKTKLIESNLSKNLLTHLLVKLKNRKSSESNGFSSDFIQTLNRVLIGFNVDNLEININSLQQKKEKYYEQGKKPEIIKLNIIPREKLSDMTIQEQIEYFSKNKVEKNDLLSLYYYFQDIENLTPEIKELINVIVEKHEDYPKNKDLDLAVIFSQENDISAYYWICQFIYEKGDWWQCLNNTQAFKEGYSLNSELCTKSIIELSNKFLEIGFNRSFSSNLLNALIEVGYSSDVIREMWNTLYTATEYRLPAQPKIDWNELLSDELDMDIEEILICILFTRFKSNTTERHHWTLSGLLYLYQLCPEKMIKPTKRFLRNKSNFLTVNLLLILEIIYDISKNDSEYHKNFIDELNSIYPSNYYLIDFIIAQLLSKNQIFIANSSNLSIPVNPNSVNVFKATNYRNEILCDNNLDFQTIVGKYKSSFRKKYGDNLKVLGNSSLEKYVKNIYSDHYLLELINQEFYNELNYCNNKAKLYDSIKVDYKTIVAQINSYNQRPLDIDKPSSITVNWEKRDVINSEWIRLGYIEYEFFEVDYNNHKQYKVFEGIVFENNIRKTCPFSRYRLFPQHIWENVGLDDYDEFLCMCLVQEFDTLENYKILWLNPTIINRLQIKVNDPIYGLSASNDKEEVVLKYSYWSCDYVGDGEIGGISDEIPKLEGGELICRKDYFQKICKLYQNKKPYSYRLKVG